MISKKIYQNAQSLNLTNQICQIHNQTFTNFCSTSSCVRPLCPQCIEDHYIFHHKVQTMAQLDSFKSLRNKCMKKILHILENIQNYNRQILERNFQQIKSKSLLTLEKLQKQSHNIIDQFFYKLKKQLKKVMKNKNLEKISILQQIQKIDYITNKYQKLGNSLQNPVLFLSTAQKISKLNIQEINEQIKSSYLKSKSLNTALEEVLYVNKNFDKKLEEFLDSLINCQDRDYLISQTQRQCNQTKSDKQLNNTINRFIKSKSTLIEYKITKQDQIEDYQKQRTKQMKIITQSNYFKANNNIFLHFFQDNSNILNILNLSNKNVQSKYTFNKITLDCKIPQYHQSIATQNGNIYMIGGINSENKKKTKKIYKYNFQKNKIVCMNNLIHQRSSHSLCINGNYIYIMGGITNSQLTKSCQRFNFINNAIEQIQPMHYASCSFAICSFNGRYIFKIGGLGQNMKILNIIEIYDQFTGHWKIINPIINGQLKPSFYFASAACQINGKQIIVFGGYNKDNQGQNQNFIIKIQRNFQLIDINKFKLPIGQGFWNNTPIIHNNNVYALQNISNNNNQCLQNIRNIIQFNGSEWKLLT